MDLQRWGFLRSQLVKRDSGESSCYLLTPSGSPPHLCSFLLCRSPFTFSSWFLFQSPSSSFSSSSVLSSSFSSAEMIQRSIHSLSDCSFSSVCPAVLPHCHSASNERSGSHGWYSRCYCAFIGGGYFCCFVICPESKNRAPRVLACNGLSLPWPWQIASLSPAGQLRGCCRGVSWGPPTKWRRVECSYLTRSILLQWHTWELKCFAVQCVPNQIRKFVQILATLMCL